MSDYNSNNNPNNTPDNNIPNNSTPNHDPYRTTGGNSGAGWQPPTSPYQPNGGQNWGAAPKPDYSTNYQNAAYGARKPEEEYKWNFSEYDNTSKKPEGKKKRKGLRVFTAIICSMLAVTVVGFAGYGIYAISIGDPSGGQTAPASPDADGSSGTPMLDINDVPSTPETVSTDGRLTTAQIAAKVQPSVVGVVAYLSGGQNIYGYGTGAIAQSEGSGIIMSTDGYIVTNAHVVSGAVGLKVVLNNGEEYEARLVGSDVNTDLAVIKIEADNLTPAEFGDSSSLQVGEDVIAIGNPGGLELASSVTKGIVSGVDRPIKSEDVGYVMNCIQTDAAINPGNSGGALVNSYGQVVGINSSKIAETSYEGLGFAIPITEAKPIVDDLIANGRVTGRVLLGVTGKDIDETTARYNNAPVGFMILSTEPGSDIASKGVVAGDIITKIDGEEVTSSSDIAEYLRKFKPDDKVTLTIFRRTSGKRDTTFEVSVALMEDRGSTTETQPETPIPEITIPGNESGLFSFFQ